MKSVLIALLSLSMLCANAYADDMTSASATSQDSQMSVATKNLNAGDAFLAANRNRPGVTQLPSGLQYKILTQGRGAQPKASDTVVVNYVGTLLNGTVFDSSFTRGEPATFPVTAVIPGWVEALQRMRVGSVWELYIPAKLAYGEQGAPPAIGPNETLIFKVTLIAIKR